MLVTEQIRFSVRSWRHTEARVWLLCVEASGKTSDNFTVGKFWPVRFMSFLKNLTGEEMYLPKVWLNEAQSLGPGMETPRNVAGGEAARLLSRPEREIALNSPWHWRQLLQEEGNKTEGEWQPFALLLELFSALWSLWIHPSDGQHGYPLQMRLP